MQPVAASARLSLSVRIIFGVVMLIFLATTVQIYLSNQLARKAVLSELQTQLETKAQYNNKELRTKIDRLNRDVTYLSRLPSLDGLVRAIEHNGFDEAEQQSSGILTKRLQGRITSFLDANPEYFEILFISLTDNSRELIHVRSAAGAIAVEEGAKLHIMKLQEAFLPAVRLNKGEVYISDIHLHEEKGELERPLRRMISAATPVYNEQGHVFGMLVINMDIGAALDKLTADNLNYIAAYMFTQTGEYIIHPNNEKIFGKGLGNSFSWQQDLEAIAGKALNTQDSMLTTLPAGRLVPFTLAGQMMYGVQTDLTLDKERILSLVYAVEQDYISARNRGINKIIILSAFAITLSITVLIYGYVRRLMTPLIQLSSVAHALGDGDFSTVMPAASVPEVKGLASALEIMRDKIIARDNEIHASNLRLKTSLDYADLIIESVPEAIIIVNAEGEIIRANQQVIFLFGYLAEELIGCKVEKLIPPQHQTKHQAHRAAYLACASSRPMGRNMELYALRKNGSEFPVEVGLNSVPGFDGLHVLATIIDLTHIKKNEEVLLHANTRFSLAASAAGVGFWDYDLTSQTLHWDDTMYHIYGLEITPQSAQPYSLWSKAVHPDDLTRSEQALQASIAGSAPFDTEFRIIHPNGAMRYIKAQAYVLRDANGAALKLYGVNLDITKAKQDEQRQQKLLREMTAINAELNSFTYIASHDLKSPLRGIDQLASWIAEDLEGQLDSGTQKHLALMQNRIKRMEKLLDDLLEYSRAGRSLGEAVVVDSRALVDDIFDLFSANKPAQLKYLSPMPVLTTQRAPLEVIFRNLIGNAIKHHPGDRIEVYIEANKRRDGFEFGVGDNGTGIAPEHHDKIFTMFQTLKPRDVVEGSGIGLALVKKTVEGRGGTIRVESDGVSGCWFYFTWPDIHQPTHQEM
ncbi:MAG: PAS domain S-box protein [Marinagarivorans sp.]